MTLELSGLSAYHGKGWTPRTAALVSEIGGGRGIWSGMRVDSEYKPLAAVLLYCPGAELADCADPNAVQHIARIRPEAIARDFQRIADVYRSCGVAVHHIRPDALQPGVRLDKYNLMYARDLFVNTREGAVVARMGSAVRAGEEKFAAHALAQLAIPINRTIAGRGLFEGADALWLGPKTVVCGLGRRTNREGFRQLRAALRSQGVETLAVDLPPGTQHLLGILQIVDARLALVRTGIAPRRLVNLLGKRRISIVEVPETDEVRVRLGMNVVTVKPRTVVMPAGCPGLRRLYERAGVDVAAEVEIDELLKGAGGLGCATGILARET